MKKFSIRTRYQRESFAMELAKQLKKSADPKTAALADCIVYVLSAPIELVNGAVVKLLREHSDLQAALDLELTEAPPSFDFPAYEVEDAGLEESC